LFVSKAHAKQTHVVITSSPFTSNLKDLNQNRQCQDNGTPSTSLRINANRLTTSPPWSSRLRQKAHEMSNFSRVREPLDHPRRHLISTLTLETNKALLDLVLEFHAWAAAKPIREHEKATELLEKEVNFIIEKEKAQGRCSVIPTSCLGTRCVVQTASSYLASFSYVTSADAPKEQTRAMLLDFIQSVRSALSALGVSL
jgi:hypothetical protein